MLDYFEHEQEKEATNKIWEDRVTRMRLHAEKLADVGKEKKLDAIKERKS